MVYCCGGMHSLLNKIAPSLSIFYNDFLPTFKCSPTGFDKDALVWVTEGSNTKVGVGVGVTSLDSSSVSP